MSAPDFGEREAGRAYRDRPSAYAVALDGRGRVLCVRAAGGLHLPGGGVEPGESEEVALLRELAEETGYEGQVVRTLGRADQYVVAEGEGAFRKRGVFFLVRVGARRSGPTDHEPVWLDRETAQRELAAGFQRWAVGRLN